MYVATTLTELIENGKELQISHRNFNNSLLIHDNKSDNTIKVPFNAIINKYRDFFIPYTVRFELTEQEQSKFWYNPRLLSYDYYGTPEYWSILLYINDCASALDFKPTKLNLILKENIKEVINEILILQEKE